MTLKQYKQLQQIRTRTLADDFRVITRKEHEAKMRELFRFAYVKLA